MIEIIIDLFNKPIIDYRLIDYILASVLFTSAIVIIYALISGTYWIIKISVAKAKKRKRRKTRKNDKNV